MKTEELNYYLPPELIAQQPCRQRSKSKLLVLDRWRGVLTDSRFDRIGDFLRPGDCLVLNDTRVVPARFFASRASGGKLEGLFLSCGERSRTVTSSCADKSATRPPHKGRIKMADKSEVEGGIWKVLLKGSQKIKVGEVICLREKAEGNDFNAALVEKREEGVCLLKVDSDLGYRAVLERIGFPPLPPYIKRDNNLEQARADMLRYQTVFAKRPGAVAAPTAGLHFTAGLIDKLKEEGIIFARVTLHVGAGTFKPVTTQTIEEHKIGEEEFCIDERNARLINDAKSKGGRIIAVGTTSVRTCESAVRLCSPQAATDSEIKACSGSTGLFIRLGFRFQIIDGMVTNFHLPRSTLLALAAAFAGLDRIRAAYNYAIERRYRFYSYGDAMLIAGF
jgi:S-adenosylmethionine:tRNA ribosyltransferase-isomerase